MTVVVVVSSQPSANSLPALDKSIITSGRPATSMAIFNTTTFRGSEASWETKESQQHDLQESRANNGQLAVCLHRTKI